MRHGRRSDGDHEGASLFQTREDVRMASATKEQQKDGKAMATDVVAPGGSADDSREDLPKGSQPSEKPTRAGGGGGYFTIYKKGQGYWTRMGTAVSVTLLAALTAYELYAKRAYFGLGDSPAAPGHRSLAMGIAAALFFAIMAFTWRLMNKPSNVDFLIATDSEMKKVNWTSRKDLIGSTKVVVAFMFFIAFFLAVCDVVLAGFFELIGVLHHSSQTIGGG
jgi:preprotein translocase SecE subunit